MASVNEQRLFLENFECFYEGQRKLGQVDITLPKFTPKTDSINGAGIAGEMNFPSSAMLENMEFVIKWRTINEDAVVMNEPRAHLLTFRGAQRIYDAAQGIMRAQAVIVDVRGVPTETDLGKFAQASETESQTTMALDYIKLRVDGNEMIEFDRFNYIYKVNGTDFLADYRAALGI